METQGGAGLVFKNLESPGVDVELYNYYYSKSTKTRVLCDGHYITRIDDDVNVPGENTLEDILKKDFSEYTYVILSDYNKGVLEYPNDIIKHINSS